MSGKAYFHSVYDVLQDMKEEEILYGRFLWATKFSGRKRVLDVGCGRGWFIKANPSFAVGLDVNPFIAKALGEEGLRVAVGDVYRLPFCDGYFDGIFANWILEHLKEPERAFKEFWRVLEPNGYLFVLVPHPRTLTTTFYSDPTHVRPYSPEEIATLAETTGFKVFRASYDICKYSRAWRGFISVRTIHKYLGEKMYLRLMKAVSRMPMLNNNMTLLEARKETI